MKEEKAVAENIEILIIECASLCHSYRLNQLNHLQFCYEIYCRQVKIMDSLGYSSHEAFIEGYSKGQRDLLNSLPKP